MPSVGRLAPLLAALWSAPAALAGQAAVEGGRGVPARSLAPAADLPGWAPGGWAWPAPPAPQAATPRSPVRPMLLSLALPGAGQLDLRQRRGWAYLALEALGWVVWSEERGAAGDLRDDYHDLAWSAARVQTDPRRDGTFAYYETLTHWTRSGAYDADPLTAGVQPETDAASFNGSIWARASGIFLPGGPVPETDPSYLSALAYYDRHAYGTEFLWDWSGTGTAQADFARLIERSDARFRRATHALGAILLNHLVASVDGYLSARGAGAPVEIRVFPSAGGGAGGAWGTLRVSLPR